VVELVQAALSPDATMAANLRRGYLALAANNVVKNEELSILDSWLDDMSALDT